MVLKISIVSDLHVDFKKQKVYKDVPLTFLMIYKQILHIVKTELPDILIIQGDLINNVTKIEIITINLLVLLFYKIFKDIKKIPIYIIQGNHDVMYKSSDDINEVGSFVSIFRNSKNVFPFTKPKKIQLLPNFNLHLFPYTTNVEEIYDNINNLNKHFNLFIFHQDFDFIENKLNIYSTHSNRVVDFDQMEELLNGSNYYILNGHYHKRMVFDDKNFTVISSLSQNSFSEQITTIDDVDKYFGYVNVEFNSPNDVKINFVPSKYRIVSLKYQNVDDFLKEFNKLKTYILNNKDTKFFKIRIIDLQDKKEYITNEIEQLKLMDNVVECNYINKMVSFDNEELDSTTSINDMKEIDIINYYKEQIKKLIEGTEYENHIDEIINVFDKIVKETVV